jgi:hypothetical protein
MRMPRRCQRVAERVLEHEADRALVSPTAYCTGTVGTWPSAISERRRMKPTCGPLPCVSTTFQPAAIIVATCFAVSQTASYWSLSAVWAVVDDEALPPTATTASGFGHCGLPFSPRPVANAFTAWVKHAIGAVVTPAPIWPTPARRCAMPLLITGSTPQSTTLRASIPPRRRRSRAPAA